MIALLFLKKFFMSKNGIIIGIILATLFGLYTWHRSVVRTVEQHAKEETRIEVLKEKQDEFDSIEKTYQETIADLNKRILSLQKQKKASDDAIKSITEKQTNDIQEINNLPDVDAVIDDICKRINCKRPN